MVSQETPGLCQGVTGDPGAIELLIAKVLIEGPHQHLKNEYLKHDKRTKSRLYDTMYPS